MAINRIALTWIAFASLPAIGNAHPGHGSNHGGDIFLHYATSPIHIVPILVAAFLLAGTAKLFRSARQLSAARRTAG
jgi:hypothetical protein